MKPAFRLPRARAKGDQLERPIQRAIITLLAYHGVIAVHVPNGVRLSGDQLDRVKMAAALKKDGVRKGFPDLIVLADGGRSGFIETKRERGGRLSTEQEWWRDELARRGHHWFLATVPEDGLAALRAWGWA